jgi:lipopolysaccharide transport system ATP-binding protein
MSDIAIRVEKLSKRYKIGVRHSKTLRDRVVSFGANISHVVRRSAGSKSDFRHSNSNHFWALKDVSFEVKQGEIVGIIGRNGAGKSTLLKILSRITEPTEGRAEVYGRLGSLLEVGTGFHHELTGRENVYLNGAILGMRKGEIDRKFDEIVAFAEVEKFIDTPVKRYSSGMSVRLAFAVAAHLEPELLLVDEVLAVGDVEFQKKCLGKMGAVAKEGRTVLFVSHQMAAIQHLCQRAILLRQGCVALDASVDAVVRDYLAFLSSGAEHPFENNPERTGDCRARLTDARVLDELNQPTQYLIAGRAAAFEFRYENLTHADQIHVAMTIYNHLAVAATHLSTKLTNYVAKDLGAEGTFVCQIPNLPLPIGQYRIAVGLSVNGQSADHIPNVLVFEVASSTFYESSQTPSLDFCTCMVPHEWRHMRA